MLFEPFCGWSVLHIGCFEKSCSYLTDPVADLTEFFTNALQSKSCAVHFDAEGDGDYDLVYNGTALYIVARNNTVSVIDLSEYSIRDLAAEFVTDVETNINAWADWSYDDDESADAHTERVQTITDMIASVTSLLT